MQQTEMNSCSHNSFIGTHSSFFFTFSFHLALNKFRLSTALPENLTRFHSSCHKQSVITYDISSVTIHSMKLCYLSLGIFLAFVGIIPHSKNLIFTAEWNKSSNLNFQERGIQSLNSTVTNFLYFCSLPYFYFSLLLFLLL